jgi:hypothetical protein
MLMNVDRPTAAFAMGILFFSLNLNPHKGRTFREHVRDFDFLGLFLIVGGVFCVLLGLNRGESNCILQPPLAIEA